VAGNGFGRAEIALLAAGHCRAAGWEISRHKRRSEVAGEVPESNNGRTDAIANRHSNGRPRLAGFEHCASLLAGHACQGAFELVNQGLRQAEQFNVGIDVAPHRVHGCTSLQCDVSQGSLMDTNRSQCTSVRSREDPHR
jgi:hypothetical protein